jgi:hypothetical protein
MRKQRRHFIQSELYDPYLSSEIISYIDPIVHKLMIFSDSVQNPELSNKITRLSKYSLNLYSILKAVCAYATPSELEYFFELFRKNIDINNSKLENLEQYIYTPEIYEIIIHEGRDLSQRVVDEFSGHVFENPFSYYRGNWKMVIVILKNTTDEQTLQMYIEDLLNDYIVEQINCLAPIKYLAKNGKLADVWLDSESFGDLNRAQKRRYNIISKLLSDDDK